MQRETGVMAVPTMKATSKPQTGRVVLPSSMVMSAAGIESTKEATLEEDDGVMRFSSWRFGLSVNSLLTRTNWGSLCIFAWLASVGRRGRLPLLVASLAGF